MMQATSRNQGGFTLVELLIALVLGLILTGGVINVFVANRQAFRTSENLARVQENGRTAFELLSRDIREAGGNPCGTKQIGNTLNNPANSWWSDWGAGALRGFDNSAAGDGASAIVAVGAGAGQRAAGTDAILVMSGNVLEGVTINGQPNAASFQVNTLQHGINTGDILMACDFRSGSIFQVTNANAANTTVVHNDGVGVPGNCSKGLGYPTVCTANGTPKVYDNGGMLVKLYSSFWYVGNNARGGLSLFRSMMVRNPATNQPIVQTDEVAEGVSNMQIEYLQRTTATNLLDGDFVPPTAEPRNATPLSIADWKTTAPKQVAATRIRLTLTSNDAVGTNQQALRRDFIGVAQLRNRDIP